ncbi:MAG: hypothetical protein E5V96_07550 [Mesorhizobium sp.]|nr:MAG: hypothetical protein E5V96_07550 [Mesorhizobium sp.]
MGIHCFGDFELNESSRAIRLAGNEIEVQPLVFDFLAILLRHQDRALSKDELLETLWPGVTVTEASLQRVASLARSVLRQGGMETALRRMGAGAGMHGAALRSDPAPDARGNGIRHGRRTPAGGFPGNHPCHDPSRERRACCGQGLAQACRAADRQSNREQGTWPLVLDGRAHQGRGGRAGACARSCRASFRGRQKSRRPSRGIARPYLSRLFQALPWGNKSRSGGPGFCRRARPLQRCRPDRRRHPLLQHPLGLPQFRRLGASQPMEPQLRGLVQRAWAGGTYGLVSAASGRGARRPWHAEGG